MIIIIGYGNTLRGDDGVGVKIVRQMETMDFPNRIKIINGGCRGIDVLINTGEFEKLIIIDSVMSGGKEGVLYRMTLPTLSEINDEDLFLHTPSWISFLKSEVESCRSSCWLRMVFYGIEIKNTTLGTELSPKIASKIPEYINSILKEIQCVPYK